MGRIPEDDVARVRDATDLVALVSETVPLKKKGRLYWGNCPFHQEKTPSFKVDPTTQLWHCFGCGRGGDAFGFLMESERLEFPDAVRRLAERARIEVREEGGRLPAGHKERLIAACEAAAEFFHRELVGSRSAGASAARQYLADRGFGIEVAKRWRLGYAPAGRDALARALMKAGFTAEELAEANLVLTDGGRVKDRFFDRIMFPIADLSGKVIAFGGRVVREGTPKYLNSQETPIFHKSSTLYGLDRARNQIVARGTAVVVEGYTDVIALHEAGIGTAVATLGTALSERHVRLLGRFGRRIVYLFDGDEAGRKAAMRAAEFVDWYATPEAGSARVDLDVALIPGELDPAEHVATAGPAATAAVIDAAQPLLRFVIDARLAEHDLSTPEGRSAALASAVQVLEPVRDSLLGQDYMNYLASRLQTDYATVARALPARRARGALRRDSAGRSAEAAPVAATPEARAARELVGLVALHPQLRAGARSLLAEEGVIADARVRRLLELVVAAGPAAGAELYEVVSRADRDAAQMLTEWLVDARKVEEVEYAFREVVARLKEFALGRLIVTKKAELRALDAVRDAEAYDRLFAEIADLQRAQQAIRTRSADVMATEMEHDT